MTDCSDGAVGVMCAVRVRGHGVGDDCGRVSTAADPLWTRLRGAPTHVLKGGFEGQQSRVRPRQSAGFLSGSPMSWSSPAYQIPLECCGLFPFSGTLTEPLDSGALWERGWGWGTDGQR